MHTQTSQKSQDDLCEGEWADLELEGRQRSWSIEGRKVQESDVFIPLFEVIHVPVPQFAPQNNGDSTGT